MRMRVSFGSAVFLISGAASTHASEPLIEEVIVSAQRVEQSVQEVPLAVTALTAQMLEDRQIVAMTDLQLNVPNLSFTGTNSGAANLSIRGVGRLTASAGSDESVLVHINDVAMPTNITTTEFYDMERVEVLRGPQGTLYGRNATAGIVNLITRQPNLGQFDGFVDLELGNYRHRRLKGAVNLPVGDRFALRIAGMGLQRDGFTENLAGGQVPGMDNDIDGRDLYSYRVSARWLPTERMETRLLYFSYREDSDRSRIMNQVCKQNELPTVGCVPGAIAFEPVNPAAAIGGFFAGMTGSVPLGARDEATGLRFDYPRPEAMDLRTVHTDVEPVYDYQEDTWLGAFEYNFGRIQLAVIGGYSEWDALIRDDFNLDVGHTLNATPTNPSGLWPTSAPPQGPDSILRDSQCDVQNGTGGVLGSCVYPVDQTRYFSLDQLNWSGSNWSVETRIQSDFDGALNFLAGVNIVDQVNNGTAFVGANVLDAVSLVGVPAIGSPPLYPGYSAFTSNPAAGDELRGYAAFGELYFQATDTLRFTLGLRYNVDEKQTSSTGGVYNSIDLNTVFGGILGPDPAWVRLPVFNEFVAGQPDELGRWLADRYDATEAIASATSPAEFAAALQEVPPFPEFNETRDFEGAPSEARWEELTGKVSVEWQWDADHLAYATFTRGYKPGGFNAPELGDLTYPEERVNAFELGSKNLFLDGSLLLNIAGFYYDYQNLAVDRQQNGLAFQDAIDSEIMGIEIESSWRPRQLPQLSVDLAYGWLHTEVGNAQWIDEQSRTQDNPDWVLLKNIAGGSAFALNYIAPIAEVLPLVDQAVTDLGALPVPGTFYENGIPAWFDRNYLEAAGVETSDGIAADLGGNALPNVPEHSVSLGIAYTWTPPIGLITVRGDYYWQDVAYARVFNHPADRMDSWEQLNLSLTYQSPDGRWLARGWVRNLGNDNNVTGHFLTNDFSGRFRNYFLTEPRIYGLSLRFAFGA